MSNELVLAGTTATALTDAFVALVDAGSGPGYMDIFQGTLPDDLAPGTDPLLAEFIFNDPSAAAAVLGVAEWALEPDLTTSPYLDGTAGYFIVYDSDFNPVAGGTVGVTGAALNFDSVNWLTSDTLNLADGTVTTPTGP